MPKNIKIVPSRGSESSKQPYIYFIDSSDQTTEAKVGSGALEEYNLRMLLRIGLVQQVI